MTGTGSQYRRAEHVHARRFDGETVILDLSRGEYFSLDGVGGAIWDALEQGLSRAEVVERLSAQYDSEVETIRADVDRIIGELLASGLLVEAP